ncbi:hypothetical protein RQ832_28445, partial [Roseomonas sp. DSM 102946]|nr:hypothetical protein [Roseomonas sp. DSM 102946]
MFKADQVRSAFAEIFAIQFPPLLQSSFRKTFLALAQAARTRWSADDAVYSGASVKEAFVMFPPGPFRNPARADLPFPKIHGVSPGHQEFGENAGPRCFEENWRKLRIGVTLLRPEVKHGRPITQSHAARRVAQAPCGNRRRARI